MLNIKNKICALHRSNRGQSIVEFCVVAPVLIMLTWAMVYITNMYIVKQKTLVASRYGVWKIAHKEPLSQIKEDINQNFFTNNKNRVRIENISRKTESAALQIIDNTLTAIEDIMGDSDKIEPGLLVEYTFPLRLGMFDMNDYMKGQKLTIQSSHHVKSNCWHRDETDVHEPIKLIWETIKAPFNIEKPF